MDYKFLWECLREDLKLKIQGTDICGSFELVLKTMERYESYQENNTKEESK